MFEKILVANRGEIAIRVMRTLEELGIASVAVYSEPDRDAPHVRRADEAYLLGPGPATESYLVIEKILEVAKQSGAEAVHPGYGFLAENAAFARACEEAGVVFIGPPPATESYLVIDKLIAVARRAGADAVHPGYGFLAENARFAEACRDAGLIFIGPTPEAIQAMGSKTRARELMKAAGVPIVPGTTESVGSLKEAKPIAKEIGYPVAVKAAGGGGGKGFRVATSKADLEKAIEGASGEGERFFSDPTVYLERYLEDPRHVEVQVLADSQGNVVHLGERDCSVQRRHQKLIEETIGFPVAVARACAWCARQESCSRP